MDQHLTQVAIAALGDAQQPGLSACAHLPRHQPEPGGEVPATPERFASKVRPPLRRPPGARSLLRPCLARGRRPAARGRMCPAPAAGAVRPRARHAGSAIGQSDPLVRLDPTSLRPDQPSAERRAQALSRRPRSGTGASRRAASWTAGARCYARRVGKGHSTPAAAVLRHTLQLDRR